MMKLLNTIYLVASLLELIINIEIILFELLKTTLLYL